MKTAKTIVYLTVVSIFAVIVSVAYCDEYSNKTRQDDKKFGLTIEQDVVETDKEGDTSSNERWEHIQNQLRYVKIGMKKTEVIELLGYPDGIEYTPSNIMQYSADDNILGNRHLSVPMHINIVLDDDNKVIEIRKNAFLYGPQPDC
ncbi:MAG: hypothetical protein HZB23_00430 [Deltaproteobacteria bacterium]|nr:hypothetical protein [Deltaproteobacteria bacterium]